VSYVSNTELGSLSISSWRRVILAFVVLLGLVPLIRAGLGWIALPLDFVCAGFVVWSLVSTFFYVVTKRAVGGVFHEPMSAKDVFFARFIIREAIRLV
jgi:hypothetical protein